ncbi:MAG: gfo/Idh/MocA family oxidoreductase [Actinobacteria bacterium]|nr:gfo/Idh/MocA family oxidoreductase [Actinomycetota bacterium]NBQ59953.1 gfo/Idh/MocA family oxidoreductase [Actinomycetota bacterium]NBY83103.1 gfo/Idh/MocA family oxidoreductase [Actinomycetota bacterium]NCU78442.1 gfo/Idh/MocA family oxidoreductase [Actinomycetota bacterium]NCU96639.1 gfo/Idh/MocA family oxidoreductase [Actinomycetota bacterium]
MIKSAKDIGFGVIGVGIMGKGHALYLSDYVKGAKVVAIYDTNLTTAANVAKEVFKKTKVLPKVYQDIDQLLGDKSVNSVIIASPDHLHAKHLTQSVLAGKNVLCEKPLASTVKEAKKVAKIVRESKSIVGVGFMRRFDKAYLDLKKEINTGKYGQVLQIRCTSRNVSSPNATTSMLLTNVAVHEIDIIRWLLGEDIVSVKVNYAKVTKKANPNLSDPISVICKSESGVLITIDIFANSTYGYEVGMEVLTENGSLVIENLGSLNIAKNFKLPGRKPGTLHKDWMGRFKPAYIAELKAFINSLQKRKLDSNFATAEDGLAASIACGLGVKSL